MANPRRPPRISAVCRARELLVGQLVGEPLCLSAAEVAEGPVGLALQAPVGVPIGFAMAYEQEGRHD
jgi:hypothetical protein